uniref:Uncharacterized protein n=1 Tax=Parascaris univalens TaxID=6257 RepID=A0A914ZSX3_PARUN
RWVVFLESCSAMSVEGTNETKRSAIPPRNMLVIKNKMLTNEIRTSDIRIYLVRSGEDCDNIMPAWRNRAFETYQAYRLLDMNQPTWIPQRAGGEDDYASDAPLTNVGALSAQLVGRAITMRTVISEVYTSPSLASIQTAYSLVSSLQQKFVAKIRVEPGLFEPLPLITKNSLPNFLLVEDLIAYGIDIDASYKPYMKMEQLMKSVAAEQTVGDAYVRIGEVGDEVAKKCSSNEKCVVIICDAIGIDALFRRITRRSDVPETLDDIRQMGKCYPQCCTLTLQWNAKMHCWNYESAAIPPMTLFHTRNTVKVPSFCRNEKTIAPPEREPLL